MYLGGSSETALPVAARQADCYLTCGEPPALVAEEIDRVRDLAAAQGRTTRFGLRSHVITRDTEAQASSDADRLGHCSTERNDRQLIVHLVPVTEVSGLTIDFLPPDVHR